MEALPNEPLTLSKTGSAFTQIILSVVLTSLIVGGGVFWWANQQQTRLEGQINKLETQLNQLSSAQKTPLSGEQASQQQSPVSQNTSPAGTQAETITPPLSESPNTSPVKESVKNEEISMTSSGYTYKNNQYGFTLNFPGVWEGLVTREKTSQLSGGKSTTIYFQVPLNSCNKTPNPKTGECYAAPMALSIYTLADWKKIQGQPSIGALIAQNGQYAFAYSPWQEPSVGLEGFDFQFSKVASSFKLLK